MAFHLSLEETVDDDKQNDDSNNVEIFGNVCIKTIPQYDVYTKQKDFNSSNHPFMTLNDDIKQIEKEKLSDDEYYKLLNKTKYSNYAQLISKNNDRFSISFNQEQIEILYKANEEGVSCGGIPKQYENEMESIIEFIKTELKKERKEEKDDNNNNADYFIRLDNCSPKDTIFGFGPFNIDSIKFAVSSLCASQRCHVILKRNMKIKSQKLLLWFIKWREDINDNDEFRCFVHNKSLTAISQYKWMQIIPKWSKQENHKILVEMVPQIQSLIDNLCKSLEDLTEFALDIHLAFKDKETDNKPQVEIIELNSFGVQMACGSALFHWIRDFKQLYGFNDKVEIRIVR